MSKRHYHDDFDDNDAATYGMLQSRYFRVASSGADRAFRPKGRHRKDDDESGKSGHRNKRHRHGHDDPFRRSALV